MAKLKADGTSGSETQVSVMSVKPNRSERKNNVHRQGDVIDFSIPPSNAVLNTTPRTHTSYSILNLQLTNLLENNSRHVSQSVPESIPCSAPLQFPQEMDLVCSKHWITMHSYKH